MANALSRLLSQPSGASTIEYALIGGVLIAGIVLAAELLGMSTNQTFSRLAGDEQAVVANAHSENAGEITTEARIAVFQASPGVKTAGMLFLVLVIGVIVSRFCRVPEDEATEEAKPLAEQAGDPGMMQPEVFAKRQDILRALSSDMQNLLTSQIRAKHLMSKRLTTIGPRVPRDEVDELMRAKRLHHLLVVGNAGELLGIISDRDFRHGKGATAGDLMTANPITVEADSIISPAITTMLSKKISCLPVVCGEKLVGILTVSDFMMALQCAMQALSHIGNVIDMDNSKSLESTAENFNSVEDTVPTALYPRGVLK